jgi:hypothetical protein
MAGTGDCDLPRSAVDLYPLGTDSFWIEEFIALLRVTAAAWVNDAANQLRATTGRNLVST